MIRYAFVSPEAQNDLENWLDKQDWLEDLARRVQHYGWKYDYRARSVAPNSFLGVLPQPLEELAIRLKSEKLMSEIPDQAIINEYLPGQGIAAHVDCKPCFGPEIATISLGDEYPMVFTNARTGVEQIVWLPKGSVCVMSCESRYLWTHEIPKRKSDKIPGGGIKKRKRRVSITFRNVVM